MVKVVVGNLRTKPKGYKPGKSVASKRVRGKDGEIKILHTLDLRSRTFGEDFAYVFGKNVAKARRDNKRLFGTPDIAPKR